MAATSRGVGRWPERSDLEVTTAMEHTPGNASEFVGECNRQLEPIEPASCSLDPGFEAVLLLAAAFVRLAMIRIMLRRLAANPSL
jgi:hypothetical protein